MTLEAAKRKAGRLFAAASIFAAIFHDGVNDDGDDENSRNTDKNGQGEDGVVFGDLMLPAKNVCFEIHIAAGAGGPE